MPSPYDGITIAMQVSPVRPGEAEYRGTSVDAANEKVRDLLRASLERKYPGATITVETGGDKPTADISGTDDLRTIQLLKYDAEKTALTIKWDISTQGLGLKERY